MATVMPKADSSDIFNKYRASLGAGEDEEDKNTKFIRTGLIPFDLLTMGKGLPLGRIIHCWGHSGDGKTTLALSIIRSLIANGRKAVFLEVEPSDKLVYDMGLANKDGPKPGFTWVTGDFWDEVQPICDAFINSDADFLVLDSLQAINSDPKKIMESGIEAHSIGVDARIQSVFLRLYHALLKRTDKTMMILAQARTKIAIGYGETTEDGSGGGNALAHYPSLRFMFLGDRQLLSEDIGNKGSGKQIAGKKGWLVAEKDRYAPPKTRIPASIIFGKGLSNIEAIKEYAVWKGIVQPKGAHFGVTLNGEESTVAGRAGLYQYIRENQKAFMEDFYSNVKGYYEYLQKSNGGALKVSD